MTSKFGVVFALSLFFALSSNVVSGDTSTPRPVPSALIQHPSTDPVLVPCEAPGSWHARFTFSNKRASSLQSLNVHGFELGRVTTMSFSKVGTTTKFNVEWADGHSEELWRCDAEEYGKISDSSDWFKSSGDPAQELIPRLFPDADWLMAKYYVGTMKVKGIVCDIFLKDPPSPVQITDLAHLETVMEASSSSALVDSTKHLPIEVQNEGIICHYTYGEVPDSLEVPEDLKEQLAAATKVRDTLNQRANKPY